MDSKKFVMSYSGGKDCMLAMYRKIKEGWTPVALITTVKKDSGKTAPYRTVPLPLPDHRYPVLFPRCG